MFFDNVALRLAVREEQRRDAKLAALKNLSVERAVSGCIEEALCQYLNEHPAASHRAEVENFLQPKAGLFTLAELSDFILNLDGGLKPGYALQEALLMQLPAFLAKCEHSENPVVQDGLQQLGDACQKATDRYVLLHSREFPFLEVMGLAYKALDAETTLEK